MKINPLTSAEENLMQIIWKLGSPFMKEIMAAYPEPKPHQNTVSTYLKILVDKEFLTTEKTGRIFKYNVAVPFDDYKRFMLDHFLKNYYNNSATELVKSLVSQDLLSAEDLDGFFEIKTAVAPTAEIKTKPKVTEISNFITELTSDKKKKDKKKKKKKK